MLDNYAKVRLRTILVLIFTVIIIAIWFAWQSSDWKNYFQLNRGDEKNTETIVNFDEIKEEIERSRNEWQTSKKYFSNLINQQLSTSTANSSIEVTPEILDDMKEKLNEKMETSTEIINKENAEKN